MLLNLSAINLRGDRKLLWKIFSLYRDGYKKNNQKLYSVDHHKGSEEQQPGEEYFDSDLLSDDGNCIDTLPHFLKQSGISN